MKNQQGGGRLPLAPTLRFSATPSAGVFATCPQGGRFERTPATPPMLPHGFGKSNDFPFFIHDFALAKSNPCGNIK